MVYLHIFLKVNIETNVLNKRLDLFNYIKLFTRRICIRLHVNDNCFLFVVNKSIKYLCNPIKSIVHCMIFYNYRNVIKIKPRALG